MIQKALVIGGTGFLGKYLVEELLKNNITVSILCRNKPDEWKFNDVNFFFGNIANQDVVNKAVKNMDCVFLVAAKAGIWGSYKSYYEPNVLGVKNVINACENFSVPKLVYTSTPSIVTVNKSIKNGDENLEIPKTFFNNYQKTKSIAEKMILDSNTDNLQTISIRPQAIWGDGDQHIFPRILKKIKKGKLSIIGEGNNKTSMSFVKNVAWAHWQAAKANKIGGNAYFINDEIPVNLWEVINEYAESLNYKLPEKKIPERLAFYLATIIEFIYRITKKSSDPPFTRYTVCKVTKDFYFSTEKAKKDFGYYEKYDLEKGKEEFKKYLKYLNIN